MILYSESHRINISPSRIAKLLLHTLGKRVYFVDLIGFLMFDQSRKQYTKPYDSDSALNAKKRFAFCRFITLDVQGPNQSGSK